MQIFFDLDGTLIDISDRHYKVYKECVVSFGGNPLGKDVYWALKRSDTGWHTILAKSNLSPEIEEQYLVSFIDKIESLDNLKIDTVFNSVKDMLNQLSSNHKLWLVSLRRNRDNLLTQLDQLDLKKYFEGVVSGHSDTKSGVLAKKAQEILQQTKVSPEDIIVGDTEADIAAAKQLGITSIAVSTGIRDKGFLCKLTPNVIVGSTVEIIRYIDKSIT